MTLRKLDNLVRVGQLKEAPAGSEELDGLRQSGLSRLADAERSELSFESRFDLPYNAVHALALYALRRLGYRSANRYLVFQVLPETAGVASGTWRVLAKAHEERNLAEYEGYLDRDERLLEDLIAATQALADVTESE